MSLAVESPSYSAELAAVQERPDAPFGMLFLRVVYSSADLPFCKKVVSTQSNEETSHDGSSKLDPIYDEDEQEDEEIPEKH